MIQTHQSVNEPVKTYEPGSKERQDLQLKYDEMANQSVEIPLLINGEEIKTGDSGTCIMPHDHKNVIARYHKAGEIEDYSLATLGEAKPGATLQVQAIRDEDPERLRYVKALGLTPGVILTVVDCAPYGGHLTIAFKDRTDTEVIGVDLADNIFVIPFQDK